MTDTIPMFMTITEAARMLRVKPGSLYKALAPNGRLAHRLPVVRPLFGRAMRVRSADVLSLAEVR